MSALLNGVMFDPDGGAGADVQPVLRGGDRRVWVAAVLGNGPVEPHVKAGVAGHRRPSSRPMARTGEILFTYERVMTAWVHAVIIETRQS